MADYEYPGSELELFAEARHWKAYLRQQISPVLRGDVLEVGAGIGATTEVLHNQSVASWTCLEPDRRLFDRLDDTLRRLAALRPSALRAVPGTLADLPPHQTFDALLYIDVLEHIDDDRGELARAIERTRPGGVVVVLSPAHQWLFSEFDAHVGHCRRYDARRLRTIAPTGSRVEALKYLDSAGLLASIGNRCVLRASLPTASHIRTWDTVLVRTSRVIDPWFGYRLGKSLLCVYRRA
jgi:SAM-dependent methyltransferase